MTQLIHAKQVKGQFKRTLAEDIKYLSESALKVETLSDTINITNSSNDLKTVFDIANFVTRTHIILSSSIEIVNTSGENMNFEVINYSNTIHYGSVNPNGIMSMNTERNDLKIKTDTNCTVTYNIKVLIGGN